MGQVQSNEGPVFQALHNKDINKLRELKAQGVKPDEEVDKNGDTPLLHVSRVGDGKHKYPADGIPQILIEMGGKESLEKKDKMGYTPLQVALLCTWHHLAEFYIKAGADTSGVRKIKDWILCIDCNRLVSYQYGLA